MRLSLPAMTVAALMLVAAPSAVAAQTAPGAQAAAETHGDPPVVSVGELRDLQPTMANPTDHASAAVVAAPSGHSMRHQLVVWNLDRSSTGRSFGVHVHVGPCVPGNGDAAGPHYNTGGPPSPPTEVWLGFTAGPDGVATSHTTSPFVIPSGQAQSLVIHEQPTKPHGDAGDRIACLPVPY